MWRRRMRLHIVPDEPPARSKQMVAGLSSIVPGVLFGLATVGLIKYLLSRRSGSGQEPGVLIAEVSTNGHSKARMGSLDSF